MQPSDSIHSFLTAFDHPTPSLLMPFILRTPDQDLRIIAATLLGEALATKRFPGRGVRHLERMAMLKNQRRSTMVACLLAILAHKKLEYVDSATSIFGILSGEEKLHVLKHISLEGDALVVNFLNQIIANAGYDSDNSALDGEVGMLAQELARKISNFGELVDEVEGFEDLEDPIMFERPTYDPHDLGVDMPRHTVHLCDCTSLYDQQTYPLFRIFDRWKPIGDDNPLILMGGEVHLKYDGKVLERSRIEWGDVNLDDADEENLADIYINPRNYNGVYERGSLSRGFMKRNPGHLSLFLHDLVDEPNEDCVLGVIKYVDPAMGSVVDWIRKSSNQSERAMTVYCKEEIGMVDEWSHSLELTVDDTGEVMLRLTRQYTDELAIILESDDMRADGGVLTTMGSVILGGEGHIEDMDAFRKAATHLLLSHTDMEIDEIDWSMMDTSQVEKILGLLVG